MNRSELNDNLIQQWSELEQRAVEGNAYLSPYFILPAIKYLTPDAEVIFVFVMNLTGKDARLTGVGIFEYHRWTKRVSVPHFTAYRSPHSYLSGLLVDEEFMDPTLEAFFALFGKIGKCSCGIEFVNRTNGTVLSEQFEITAANQRIVFREYNRKQRAILIPQNVINGSSQGVLSQKFKKNLRYSHNILSRVGEIRWNVVRDRQVGVNCIDQVSKTRAYGLERLRGHLFAFASSGRSFFSKNDKRFCAERQSVFH